MRYWLFPVLVLILFSACSRDTAYKYFTKLDSRHERAVTQLRRITLKEGERTEALISIIYLNPVDPELYRRQHFFFVALYDKRGTGLDAYRITLNGKVAAGVAQLDDDCDLRSLMPLNNPWNAYYEVVFDGVKDDGNITLRFETDPSLQGEVTYDTDQ